MALVVASLAWMWPTRTIRSQVLSLRERGYVQVAKMSRDEHARDHLRELLPNLLPYLAGSFVGAVGSAILASIGLEALGLGPQNEPTMGMTIYWSIAFNALIRGLWWWWLTPIVPSSCSSSADVHRRHRGWMNSPIRASGGRIHENAQQDNSTAPEVLAARESGRPLPRHVGPR
ncbi:MAG: ABC transporter permease subunit [Thermomicrobiales bacterium]